MRSLIIFDETLAAHFYSFVSQNPLLAKTFALLAVGTVYTVPFILLIVWFTRSRKATLGAGLTGAFAWFGLSKLIAAIVVRPRPSSSGIGVKELVFHRPDNSFPSDHAAFMTAVAVAFYLAGYPKLGNLVLILAIITGVTRVGIGVHFPGDVLAGSLVGVAAAYLIHLIDQPLEKYLFNPLIGLARKVRL